MLYSLFVQALGLIPSVVCFTALQSNDRRRILLLQIGCCVAWAFHYGLLGAATGVLINAVGIFRAVLCFCNDRPWAKSRLWPLLFCCLYLGSALLTWDGVYCLLPALSMMLTTFALWTHDLRRTRFLFLLNSPPLLLYNFLAGSYACTLTECFALASFVLAIYRFDLRRKPAV